MPKQASKRSESAALRPKARPSAPPPNEGGGPRRTSKKQPLLDRIRGPRSIGYFLVFLGAALVVQGMHALEHIAQSVQVFVLGVPRAQAGGLLGAWFDFPWVHFTYNFAFFLALLWACAWAFGLGGFARFDRLGLWCLLLAAGIQTYHAAEHVIQISQEIAVGTQRPPGFIGLFADNVLIHLFLNLIVWVLPLIAFLRFGGVGVMKEWILSREVKVPATV